MDTPYTVLLQDVFHPDWTDLRPAKNLFLYRANTRKLHNTASRALVFKFVYGVRLIAKIFLYVTGNLLSTTGSAVSIAEVEREDRKRPVNYHK
jgi:hypothetical protein